MYKELDELQDLVNLLLDENDRLRKQTEKEREEENKMVDELYRDWFKEFHGVYPDEYDKNVEDDSYI